MLHINAALNVVNGGWWWCQVQ